MRSGCYSHSFYIPFFRLTIDKYVFLRYIGIYTKEWGGVNMKPTIETKEYLTGLKQRNYDSRVTHFLKEVRILNLPKTLKATRLLLEEMTVEKGFSRHDGRDYFVHPIAIAQVALDFNLVGSMIAQGQTKKADVLLSSCLLHDIVEDVPEINLEFVEKMFGSEIMQNVSNLTKYETETFEQYIARFADSDISAIVKVLDRMNNVMTLSQSSLKHRKKQLSETMDVYIPLTKVFRRKYWEYGDFFFQSRTIMLSVLAEVERGVAFEEKYLEVEDNTTR